MTRIFIAFLAGALCGTLWFRSAPAPTPPPAHPPAKERTAGVLAGWPGVVLDAARRDGGEPAGQRPAFRNLFAFLEPAPPPPAEKPRVLPIAPVTARMQPYVAEPPAPPHFPYRYIGTFGPRNNALAVFARDGEVINARVGDTVGERFRLQRIGIESVDLSWGGPSELRVGVGR